MSLDIRLTPVEARVLGCLLEKEATTPNQYPLSLNALVTACNQRSNREPVMELSEEIVRDAMGSLRDLRVAFLRHTTGGRVEKFAHGLDRRYPLDPEEMAVLTMLLLRGPQTAGEVRTRSKRIQEFDSTDQVEEILQRLARDEEKGPFVRRLPKEPGTREHRWVHLFCGDPEEVQAGGATEAWREAEESRPRVRVREKAPRPPAVEAEPESPSAPDRTGVLEDLAEELRSLKERVQRLEAALGLGEETSGAGPPDAVTEGGEATSTPAGEEHLGS